MAVTGHLRLLGFLETTESHTVDDLCKLLLSEIIYKYLTAKIYILCGWFCYCYD